VEGFVLVEFPNLAGREHIVVSRIAHREEGLTKSLELLALPPPPTPRVSSMLSSKRIETACERETGGTCGQMGGASMVTLGRHWIER